MSAGNDRSCADEQVGGQQEVKSRVFHTTTIFCDLRAVRLEVWWGKEHTMTTDIEIIGIKELKELYGFSKNEVYRIVNVKGCPLLPREPGGPYRLIKDEFENWLRRQRN